MACLVGVRVYKIVLNQNPGLNSLGYIEIAIKKEPTAEFIEAQIATYLAGMEAERVFLKGAQFTHSKGDYKRIFRLIVDLYYYEGVYDHLDREGRKLFLYHQLLRRSRLVAKLMRSKEIKASISHVAKLLIAKKTLSRSQITLLSRKIWPRSAYSIRRKVTSMYL